MSTSFTLEGVSGEIYGELHRPAGEERVPALVLCHDLGQNHRSGIVSLLAEKLAAGGVCAAVTFSYSNSGFDEQGELLYPERLRRITMRAMQQDLGTVLTHLFEYQLPHPKRYDFRRLACMGIGLGGALVLKRVAADSRLKGAATLEAPARVTDLYGEQWAEYRHSGSLPVTVAGGQRVELTSALRDEVEARPERLEIARRVAPEIEVPLLLLQGADSERLSERSARDLLFANSDHARLELLEGVGSDFQAGSDAILDETRSFLEDIF